ncbi:histidine phosphatase family protein [Leptothoe sp. PORK10 BA2]|uniref:histidine phosphatase family protein n=1 Tax=Leptothoe sp. PORK10 BA2 TaxID=3110254 RepID=UPI002B2053EF|nr:histidine phosphatase family protein [Leptothoe sp. PORK10 BA2]MEA5466823.1 histidine phosphatase family protein [Leptothoe sp. PORK10 BA2]
MPKTTRVILVRHGRSSFNDQGRYQGSSNESVLTQTGIETARLLGQYLKERSVDTPIDLIYTSPLRRVQQTAHEISQAMTSGYTVQSQLPTIITSHDLKEISLSIWEGLTYSYVKQQFASQYHCWQQHPHEFKLPVSLQPPEGGSIAVETKTYFPVQDLYRNARQFWTEMLPRHAGKTILIVSHSGTIHALLSTALGISPAYHHSLQQSNCGVSELTFSAPFPEAALSEQSVQLHQLNQTAAIGETLPKLKVNKQGMRLLLVNDDVTTSGGDRLTDRLRATPIDFCLSADGLSADGGQAWLGRLTEHSPRIFSLGTQKADFLQTWQENLKRSYQSSSCRAIDGLMTALVLAPRTSIQQLIMQTLGGRLEDSDRIILQQGYFSVIHFPHDHRPVVQAINT